MRRSTPNLDQDFPATLNRDYERQLLDLCASRTLDCARWTEIGPRFFMAGIAVMPGASKTEVFAQWLKGTPLRPSRFLPMLKIRVRRRAAEHEH
jgi:hypothetical protein